MALNRRSFLGLALAAGAFPLVPGCFSSRAYAVNGKVRLAAIGCGAQACSLATPSALPLW